MRFILGVLLFVLPLSSVANMASPFQPGAQSGIAISSKSIDILSENLVLDIDKEFTKAKFTATYTINVFNAGAKLPLLFYAINFRDSFLVKVDGKTVVAHKITSSETLLKAGQFYGVDSLGRITVQWNPNQTSYLSADDLYYFDFVPSSGPHTIEVSYRTQPGTNRSDLVQNYFLEYSLSPASNWKSFGKLNYTINFAGDWSLLKTNIGKATSLNSATSKTWQFDSLPSEFFTVHYQPQLSARTLSYINWVQNWRFWVYTVIALVIHFIAFIWYRRKDVAMRFNSFMIIGVFIVPLVFVYFLYTSYQDVDAAIGMHASQRHGYMSIIILFLYPLLVLCYWLPAWLTDYLYKRALIKSGKHVIQD